MYNFIVFAFDSFFLARNLAQKYNNFFIVKKFEIFLENKSGGFDCELELKLRKFLWCGKIVFGLGARRCNGIVVIFAAKEMFNDVKSFLVDVLHFVRL